MHLPHGALADLLGGSLGIAAILLVVGWFVIRWQADRHRFLLMRTALERGITRVADAPPYWILSFRQGATMLALGLALTAVGGAAWWLGSRVPMPATNAAVRATTEHADFDDAPPPPPDMRPGAERAPLGGPERESGPGFDRPPARRPHPPAPDPQMERWHRAQDQQFAGLAAGGLGVVLIVVGLVRIFFVQIERQYASELPPA